ncbi:MAG: hypothetical protein PHD03_02460 [Bacilli bacterium]|nr:hypothetical protein [Bacilli bacterium]MDD4406488.1 hypothetical protein [Bacilli bacterium]
MKKFLKLTKINLYTLFDFYKILNARGFKEIKKILPMLLLYIFSFGFLAFMVYKGIVFTLDGLIALNMPYIILVTIMVTVSVTSAITTVFKVNKTLFNAKDYSFLLSLPIKKSTIISSKIMNLYIINVVFSAILLIPTYIAYIVKVDVDIWFHLMYFITFVLIPIVPTIIGSIIGTIFMAIVSNLKYKTSIDILISILFIFVIYYLSYKMQSMSSIDLANISNVIVNKFNNIYPLTKVYLNIIKENSIFDLIFFIIISVGLYQVFKFGLVKFFDNINSKLSEVTIVNKYRDKDVKVSSKLYSLYKKEIKRYFSSSLYVLNTAIGCIMLLLVLGAFAIFGGDTINKVLEIPELSNYLVFYGPLVFGVFCIISCTTNSSISLEGKNLWILKSLPINIKDIFISKIMVNLTILLPTIFIGSIMLAYISHINIIQYMVLLFTPCMYALFISSLGLLINLFFPDFNWTNEVKVIKQSIAVIVTLAVGMLVALGPLFIKIDINKTLYSFLVGIIIFLLTMILYYILFNKGKRIFKSL